MVSPNVESTTPAALKEADPSYIRKLRYPIKMEFTTLSRLLRRMRRPRRNAFFAVGLMLLQVAPIGTGPTMVILENTAEVRGVNQEPDASLSLSKPSLVLPPDGAAQVRS